MNCLSFTSLRLALTLVIASLASCGGGGGGAAPVDATVVLSPGSWNATFPPNMQFSQYFSATIAPLPQGTVYPVIAVDKPVLATGVTAVTHNTDGSFTAKLGPASNLAVGEYKGTITLHLCKDAACASEYSLAGNTLPYDFHVVAQLGLTVLVNGIAVESNLPVGSSMFVHPGDRIVMTADQPVKWEMYTGQNLLSDIASTATTWSATVVAASGGFYLNVSPPDTPLNLRQPSFMIR